MKNYITLTAAAMAALTLGACSDTDVVDFRPAGEIEGLVEAENFDLDVNGYPVPSRAVFLLSDTAQRSNPSDTYEMILAMDAFNKEKILHMDHYDYLELESLQFPVTVTGDQSGMTFSGSVSDCGVTYTIEGTMPAAGSTSKKVKAHVTCDASALPYAGMTYELSFDESGVGFYYGIMTNAKSDAFGEPMELREVIEKFGKRVITSFAENSGYNSALITFNPDLSMKVMMRKNSDGLYEEIDGHFSYKPMVNGGYIGFRADPEFSSKRDRWRNIGDDLWACKRTGLTSGMGDLAVYDFGILTADGTMELKYVSPMSYLNGWAYGEGKSPMALARSFIVNEVLEHDVTFDVCLKGKPISFGKE